MLAHTYRFTLRNECGQTLAQNNATVTARKFKWSAGTKSYDASEDTDYTMDDAGGLADGSYDNGSTVDNSSDLWDGGDFVLSITAPASASGEFYLYYDVSTDGGTDWPTNGYGRLVAVIAFTSSGTKSTEFCL